MKRLPLPLICLAFVLRVSPLGAFGETDEVRNVLEAQAKAWNRGDLVRFVDSYADDAVFVGTEVTRGRSGVLARYKTKYDTPEKRGKLDFTDLEIRSLGSGYVSVIGRFHLTRPAAGGGDTRGIFTLLLEKKIPGGWKIILDHTA